MVRTSLPCCWNFRCMVEYQWFLTSLSERPGSCLEIAAHLFPCRSCIAIKIDSSLSVQSPFLRSGSKWLTNRSLHCFPWRPGRKDAILAHFLPNCFRFSFNVSSSSGVQLPLPLITGGLEMDWYLERQSMAALPEKLDAIWFQRGPPVHTINM